MSSRSKSRDSKVEAPLFSVAGLFGRGSFLDGLFPIIWIVGYLNEVSLKRGVGGVYKI